MKWKIYIWLFCLCSCAPDTAIQEVPSAIKGQLDVRHWDFERSSSLPLSGEWNFHWQQLLSPQTTVPEVSTSKNKTHTSENFQRIGERWKNKQEGVGYATYQLKVLLPETAKDKTFALRFFQTGGAALSVYIDGSLKMKLGEVGTEREAMTPTRSSGLIFLPHPKQEVHILIHISNFHHDDGAFWYPPELGYHDKINKQILNDSIRDSILTGALLFMAFYHFVVFLYRRNRSLILFFGLYSLFIGLHSISLNGDSLYYLFPEVSYRFAFTVSLIFYLAMPCYLIFLYQLFPENFSKRLTYFFLIIFTGLYIFVLVTPSEIGSQTTYYGLFLSDLALLYSIFCLAYAAYQKKELARPLLVIQIFLLFSVINDTLYLYGILKYFLILKYSYLSTVLFQSLVLASYFTKSFIKAEVLGKELIKLNESLEKTVILRTNEYKEAKQIAEEANEWKNKFISLVAHDLRSPLSTVHSALTIATDPSSTEEEKTHIFKQLFVILENAMTTVEHLLNLNRFNTGQINLNLSQIKLYELLQPFHESFSFELQKKSLQIKINISEEAKVYADESILIELLRNLIANAIKFSNQNGLIQVSFQETGTFAQIIIQDNGQGIPSDRQKDLFTKQITTPGTLGEKGFGIGLKLCFELMRLHKGNIYLESELNKGSKFILEFPKTVA